MERLKKVILWGAVVLPLFIFPAGVFALDSGGQDAAGEFAREYAQEKKAVPEKGQPEKREEVMESSFRKITMELTLEYAFAIGGEQSFKVVDSQENVISKLTYPIDGDIYILKGEIGLGRIFLGGRYADSQFKRNTNSDEDWNLFDATWPYGTDSYIDYTISKQNCKSKVNFYDLNLYYRLLDYNRDQAKERFFSSVFVRDKQLWDYVQLDKIFFDMFAGYQSQAGRFCMKDPMKERLFEDEGVYYYTTGLPDNIGLDSFYKIEYKGPRLGVRMGTQGRLSSRFSFAYSWLTTKAYGWWNLRTYSFEQNGSNGRGLDFSLELTYRFIPRLSAGLGYNYFLYRQKRMTESGNLPGYVFSDLDGIRNADYKIYGPSFVLKYSW